MSNYEKIRAMSRNVLSHRNLSAFAMIAFVSAMSIGCGKSGDAKPAGGCNFTFMGASYSLVTSACGSDASAPDVKLNAGSNASGTQLLSLSTGEDGGVSYDAIIWVGTVGDATDMWEQNGPVSISISGTTWTFSGTLLNSDDGVTEGEISGKCTCTINN